MKFSDSYFWEVIVIFFAITYGSEVNLTTLFHKPKSVSKAAVFLEMMKLCIENNQFELNLLGKCKIFKNGLVVSTNGHLLR